MKNDERAKQVVEETYRQNNQKRHLLDVLAILSTVEGRRFIIELLGACRVFKNNWTPSAEIHRFEGMRHIGLTVLRDIEDLGIKGLELYHTAQKEYISVQLEEERQRGVDIAKLTKEGNKRA